jgi:hypothetical protein
MIVKVDCKVDCYSYKRGLSNAFHVQEFNSPASKYAGFSVRSQAVAISDYR